MGDLRNTPAPQAPLTIATRMLAQRIRVGVAEYPTGPYAVPVIYRNSSFGGFPVAPLAMPALNPAAVIASYAFGD